MGLTLAEWFSGLNGHHIHQKVVGLIPGQCINLGCEFDLRLGHIYKATD